MGPMPHELSLKYTEQIKLFVNFSTPKLPQEHWDTPMLLACRPKLTQTYDPRLPTSPNPRQGASFVDTGNEIEDIWIHIYKHISSQRCWLALPSHNTLSGSPACHLVVEHSNDFCHSHLLSPWDVMKPKNKNVIQRAKKYKLPIDSVLAHKGK